MIAARSGRTDITNILLNGEHIDLDIQENVRIMYYMYVHNYGVYNNTCMHINLLHTVCVCIVLCLKCVLISLTEDWMVCSILLC